jgi:DNA repair photolyase
VHRPAQPAVTDTAPALPRGRGTAFNPPNRYDRLTLEPEPGAPPERVETELYVDASRTILSDSESPDLGFRRSVNPYRGCEHGCAYCYARPFHDHLGWGSGIDFETKLLVKPDAPRLLREALMDPRYEPRPLALSGITDPYQPVERRLRLTRGCLEVLAELRHPTGIITKSALVERDADLLGDLARDRAASVAITITTLDAELQRRLEPRAASPRARLDAMRRLTEAGVPVMVNVSPVIPGLTDHEIPAILSAAREAGAQWATWILLRLPHGLKEIFEAWLDAHYPLRKARVLNALREMHGGKLYSPEFGQRMRGSGPRAEQLHAVVELWRRKLRFAREHVELSTEAFLARRGVQGDLFGP